MSKRKRSIKRATHKALLQHLATSMHLLDQTRRHDAVQAASMTPQPCRRWLN